MINYTRRSASLKFEYFELRAEIMPSDTGIVQGATLEQVETRFNEFATVGKFIDRPELARVYVYVCYYGPATRPQIQSALSIPKTTVYEYVDALVDLGVVEIADERPAEIMAEPVHIIEDEIAVTPTILHAVALQTINDSIADFVAKHGVGKLAAAVRQAGLHYAGRITQRMAADPLEIHTGEAILILDRLRPVIAAGREYDPYFTVIFPDVASEIEFQQDIDTAAPVTDTDEK